jgi:hypothetical protein
MVSRRKATTMASVTATMLKWSASREISENSTLKKVPSIARAQTLTSGYRSTASRQLATTLGHESQRASA